MAKGQNRRQLLYTLLGGIVAMAMVLPAQAPARSGQLDSSFGTRGRAVVALDLGDPRFWYFSKVHAARTRGGGIVVAGDNLVVRFSSDGQVDKGFAEKGILHTEAHGGEGFQLNGLAVDPLGRIVVAGSKSSPGSLKVMVLRFTPNGVPDPSFGSDGAVVTDFGIQLLPDSGSLDQVLLSVAGMALDAKGRIVVSGSALRAVNYCTEEGAFVGRLTSNGNIDPSFGAGGAVVYDASTMHSADGLVVQQPGAPFFFGWDGYCHGDTETHPFLVNRLNIDGSPDTGFGQNGQVVVNEYPSAIALDRLGRVLVLQKHSLLRLLPSGVTDRNFGKSGTAATFLRGKWSGWDGLAVTHNGDVLVTGHQVHFFGKSQPRRRLVLAHLNPHGALDRSFGDVGIVREHLGRPSNMVGRQVLLDGNDRAIVVGSIRNRRLSTGEGVALFRYELSTSANAE